MAIAAVFAGWFQLPRNLYLVAYIALTGAFLVSYMHWSGDDIVELARHHWLWGILVALPVAYFVMDSIWRQPASARPEGSALVLALAWLGVVYGAIDGLFLSVLPVHATWKALTLLGWTQRWPGRIAAGILALLMSMLVIGAYHLGYPEFRGPQVLLVIAGNSVMSLAYLLTGSLWAAVLPHVAMHVAAVLHGMESVMQLPPHY
jgi:hypothetical protein